MKFFFVFFFWLFQLNFSMFSVLTVRFKRLMFTTQKWKAQKETNNPWLLFTFYDFVWFKVKNICFRITITESGFILHAKQIRRKEKTFEKNKKQKEHNKLPNPALIKAYVNYCEIIFYGTNFIIIICELRCFWGSVIE